MDYWEDAASTVVQDVLGGAPTGGKRLLRRATFGFLGKGVHI